MPGQPQTLRILIDYGMNIRVEDGIGQTPLMIAAAGGNVDLARQLLLAGATLWPRDSRGNTALHYAAETGTPKIRCRSGRPKPHPRPIPMTPTPLRPMSVSIPPNERSRPSNRQVQIEFVNNFGAAVELYKIHTEGRAQRLLLLEPGARRGGWSGTKR